MSPEETPKLSESLPRSAGEESLPKTIPARERIAEQASVVARKLAGVFSEIVGADAAQKQEEAAFFEVDGSVQAFLRKPAPDSLGELNESQVLDSLARIASEIGEYRQFAEGTIDVRQRVAKHALLADRRATPETIKEFRIDRVAKQSYLRAFLFDLKEGLKQRVRAVKKHLGVDLSKDQNAPEVLSSRKKIHEARAAQRSVQLRERLIPELAELRDIDKKIVSTEDVNRITAVSRAMFAKKRAEIIAAVPVLDAVMKQSVQAIQDKLRALMRGSFVSDIAMAQGHYEEWKKSEDVLSNFNLEPGGRVLTPEEIQLEINSWAATVVNTQLEKEINDFVVEKDATGALASLKKVLDPYFAMQTLGSKKDKAVKTFLIKILKLKAAEPMAPMKRAAILS